MILCPPFCSFLVSLVSLGKVNSGTILLTNNKIQQTDLKICILRLSSQNVCLDSSLLLSKWFRLTSVPRKPISCVQIECWQPQFLMMESLPQAPLGCASVISTFAQKTLQIVDQLNNTVIKMKQPGNGGNSVKRLSALILLPSKGHGDSSQRVWLGFLFLFLLHRPSWLIRIVWTI